MENRNTIKKSPVYMYQCVMCKKYIYTEDTTLRHCGKLTQWILGIPGRGLNMDSPKVKIKVSGYIEMSEENLDNILAYDDPHQGLVYSIHMGYCDASNLQFIDPRD